MKICVLTTRHSPKDDRIYYKEALTLAAKYGRIDLVAPGAAEDIHPADERCAFHLLRPRQGMLGRFGRIVEAIKVVRKLNPDVCHFHDFDLGLAVPLLASQIRARLVYDVHELNPETVATRIVPSFFRPLIRWSLTVVENYCARRCSLVITAVDPLTERFARAGACAVTVFNYPRLELFAGSNSRTEGPAFYPGRRVLLYQGRITVARGLLEMIRAVRIVKGSVPNVLLVLLGPIALEDRNLADRLITELGVQGWVTFAGNVEHLQVFDFIRQAEIGLIPFLPVGQHGVAVPIKLFEYLGCGVPVVGSDLPTTKYYINESGAGKTYPATSHVSLAAAVSEMLRDDLGRDGMRRRGLLAVRERWNWERMEKRLLEAYGALEPPLNSVPRTVG